MKKNNLSLYEKLSKNSINLGLDLQGGMHVVLEADVPNLVKKLANNKSPELLNAIKSFCDEQKNNTVSNFLDQSVLVNENENTKKKPRVTIMDENLSEPKFKKLIAEISLDDIENFSGSISISNSCITIS